MQESTQQRFVIDLLATLRRSRFSLRAWRIFFQRSWLKSCQTASANPALKQSWRRVTGFIALLALFILIGNSLFVGVIDTIHLLPGFILCVAWQQSDLFWHLGLNRSVQSGKLLPNIGVATTLTLLRGLGASYLLGKLAGGLAVSSSLALIIFLCGIATDVLDGLIARWAGTQSRLGQIADAEADFCLSLALTLILLQNGVLPLWVGLVMLLRFILPLGAALWSYLVWVQPVRFGSTWWGKCAGLAQCLYFLILLAPQPLSPFAQFLTTPLLCVMIFLFVTATGAQIIVNIYARIGIPTS